MKTTVAKEVVLVLPTGYSYERIENLIRVPFNCRKEDLVRYIRGTFGADAFNRYLFIKTTWKALRTTGIDRLIEEAKKRYL